MKILQSRKDCEVCKILQEAVEGGKELCSSTLSHKHEHGMKLAGSHSEAQTKIMFFHTVHYQAVDYRARWHPGHELALIR